MVEIKYSQRKIVSVLFYYKIFCLGGEESAFKYVSWHFYKLQLSTNIYVFNMVLIILIMGEHLFICVVTTSKNTGRPLRNYICLKI